MAFNPSIANITQQYRNLKGKPYITVSAKGVHNEMSDTYNDGADFGPDTMLGATSPNQIGEPYTQTTGLQEAYQYALNKAIPTNIAGSYYLPKIVLGPGIFNINRPITISGNNNIKNIWGLNIEGTYFSTVLNPTYTTGEYVITLDGSYFFNVNIKIKNLTVYPYNILTGASNYVSGVLYFGPNSSSPYPQNVICIDGLNTADAGYTEAPIYLDNSCQLVEMIDYENYNSTGTYPGGFTYGTNQINIYGGYGSMPSLSNTGIATYDGIQGLNGPINVENITGLIIRNSGNITGISGPIITGTTGQHDAQWVKLQNVWLAVNSVTKPYIFSATGSPGGTFWTDIILSNVQFRVGSSTNWYMFDPSYGVSINNYILRDITYIQASTGTMSFGANGSSPWATPNASPAVPASGTAQQNTNPYTVEVYLYGGSVTEIQITKNGTTYTVFSNSTGLSLSGQSYRLDPGDSITLTYTTAPTWTWLPA